MKICLSRGLADRLAGDVERIVLASTSEVYGTAAYTPIDEVHRLHPQSPYAASKVAADALAQQAGALPGSAGELAHAAFYAAIEAGCGAENTCGTPCFLLENY